MKPTSKVPVSKRLKLNYDKLVIIFGFNFNLRRHISVVARRNAKAADAAGRAVQIDPIKPTLEPTGTKRV